MAFASTTFAGEPFTGSGHVYAIPTECGGSECPPAWSVDVGDSAYVAARNGLLYVATHGGFLVVYPERCEGATTCDPLWSYATFDGGAPYTEPIITDRAVYASGDTGQIYAFSVPAEADR